MFIYFYLKSTKGAYYADIWQCCSHSLNDLCVTYLILSTTWPEEDTGRGVVAFVSLSYTRPHGEVWGDY